MLSVSTFVANYPSSFQMKPRTVKKPSYHHGNLRQALLDQALKTLRQQSAETISLRALASALGVSQAAPYRHFAGKDGLLAELATEGFRALLLSMTQRREGRALSPLRELHALALGYVAFAVQYPEQYRLMFGSYRIPNQQNSELVEAGDACYQELQRVVRRCVDSKDLKRKPIEVLTIAAWSLVHGLASLAIDGRLSGAADPNDLADQLAWLLLEGMTRTKSPERSKVKRET
jgi:AcrR family transcriptional regulator